MLLAYAKLALHDALLESAVPDDPYLATELVRYFPRALRDAYPDGIAGHKLRREIVATQLANAIVNRGGPAHGAGAGDADPFRTRRPSPRPMPSPVIPST